MSMTGERLGENIRNLEISGNMWKSDNPSFKGFPDRVIVHFNMLGALMIDRIGRDLNSTGIIGM
jgi:hypothetical protein